MGVERSVLARRPKRCFGWSDKSTQTARFNLAGLGRSILACRSKCHFDRWDRSARTNRRARPDCRWQIAVQKAKGSLCVERERTYRSGAILPSFEVLHRTQEDIHPGL